MYFKTSIKKAASWAALESVSAASANLASLLVMSRVLKPEEFGAIAYAQSIAVLVQLVAGVGIADAIIQKRQLDRIDEDSAFWFSSLSGFAGALFCLVMASRFHGESLLLTAMMATEALACLGTGFNTLHAAILTRELRTRELAFRTIFGRALFLAVILGLVPFSFGAWSIVAARLVQIPLETWLVWRSRTRMPQLQMSGTVVWQLIRFGFPIMFDAVLWQAVSRIFSIVVGSLHGLQVLGLLNMALRVTEAVSNIFLSIATKIGFPVFARAQDDIKQLRRAFAFATELTLALVAPVLVGLAYTANLWTALLLGSKWLPMVPMVQIFLVSSVLVFARVYASICLKATGHTQAMLLLGLFASAVAIGGAYLTAYFGAQYLAIAWAARLLITFPLGVYMLRNTAGIHVKAQLAPLGFPLLLCAMMLASLVAMDQLWLNEIAGVPVLVLGLSILTGVLSYSIPAALVYRRKLFGPRHFKATVS